MTWSISGCHNKRVWLHLFSWLDCSWQNVLIPYGLPLYLLAAGNVRLFLLLLVSRCDKRFPCDILNSPSARNVMDYFLKLCCHSALLYDNIKLPYIALSFKKHFQKNTKLSNFPTHIPDHVPGNDRAAFSCDASLRENAWNKRTAEWLVTVFFFQLALFPNWRRRMTDGRLQSSDQAVWSKHSWGKRQCRPFQLEGMWSRGKLLHLSPLSHKSNFGKQTEQRSYHTKLKPACLGITAAHIYRKTKPMTFVAIFAVFYLCSYICLHFLRK